MSNINKPKGTKDIFGNRQRSRRYVIEQVELAAQRFNFEQIETPIFEKEEVYKRSVGETSDIVSKEMYAFKDKKDRQMVLRPEGTAGTIRAIVENKLYAENPNLKVFYTGPMFRYENPQKGRQRQFTQFGVEAIGEKSPFIDVEVILLAWDILDLLGIDHKLVINSLGDKETRDNYSKALREYFEPFKDQLLPISIERLEKNPLRILDDKVESKKDFVMNAPKISEYYNAETKEYFGKVLSQLDKFEIPYEVDTNLVRGLDYYTDTAFEFVSVSDVAGSQGTIIGGGRYSNLVKQFGGPDLPGVGFGLGIERLVNDFESLSGEDAVANNVDVYVMNIGEEQEEIVSTIANRLRLIGLKVEFNRKKLKIQKAFEKADKLYASVKVIVGPRELADNKVMVKIGDEQKIVSVDDIEDFIMQSGGKNETN